MASGEFPILTDTDIHVWSVALDVSQESAGQLLVLLSADEHVQAERLRTEDLRRRFVVRRARLRELLGRYLEDEPSALRFDRGALGKPSLARPWSDSRLCFSASHSTDLALVAVSLDRALGVDVERVRPMPDLETLCRNYFAPSESEALRRLPESERLASFFRAWVRKEAMLKALGTGLSFGLDQVVVSLDAEIAQVIAIRGNCRSAAAWRVDDLRPHPNYAAALARPAGDCRVAFLRSP
mgnify:CR=1 FL=1